MLMLVGPDRRQRPSSAAVLLLQLTAPDVAAAWSLTALCERRMSSSEETKVVVSSAQKQTRKGGAGAGAAAMPSRSCARRLESGSMATLKKSGAAGQP